MRHHKEALAVLGAFCLILSINAHCVCAQEREEFDFDTLFSRVDLSDISSVEINSALPILTEENMISRLRSGDTDFVRGVRVAEKDSVKKCLIIGASLVKSNWDWHYFLRGKKSLNSLKFSTDQNLTTVNHFLQSIGADRKLLHEVDSLKSYFEASSDSTLPISEINELRQSVVKKIEVFATEDSTKHASYMFGRWLVWESECSFLCLKTKDDVAQRYLLQKMNDFYRVNNVDQFLKVIDGLSTPGDQRYLERIREIIMELRKVFEIRDIKEVQDLKSRIDEIFYLLNIKFF